jgi:lactate dehydrogenase-like 2-hydroxyacid dehydrogenase
MIVVMGDATDVVDAAACQARGIEIVHLPPDRGDDQARLDQLMYIVEGFTARVYN